MQQSLTNRKEFLLILGAAAIALLFVVGWHINGLRADTKTDHPGHQENRYRKYTFFASTTNPTLLSTSTSATSTDIVAFNTDFGIDRGYFVIAGAKEANVFFTRSTAGSGASRFSIQVTATSSPVETDWYDYNRLSPNTVAGSANDALARVGTSSISATTGTNIFSLEILGWYAIRCIVVETTDGTHVCEASAAW